MTAYSSKEAQIFFFSDNWILYRNNAPSDKAVFSPK